MEAAICNLVEQDDQVIVGVNGFFSAQEWFDIVQRCGGRPGRSQRSLGANHVSLEARQGGTLANARDPRLFALVHAETSTGALQPLSGIYPMRPMKAGLSWIADTVTSLAGCELDIDRWWHRRSLQADPRNV